jgi:hypothetical protein
MTRLCIVARGELMLYGYLTVALGRELEGPDRMEIIFDRRRPAVLPEDPSLGVERRTNSAVDGVLQTQRYVILDENGKLLAPKLAASPRRTARSVVRLVGVLGVLGVLAILAGVVASSPPLAIAPAPMVAPPEPMHRLASTSLPPAVGSVPADRSPAPAEPLMRRPPAVTPQNPPSKPSTQTRAEVPRPAVASVTPPARESAPAAAEPTVVLEAELQGAGNQRSITYTASIVDARGQPLTNAEVSLLGWMPGGGDLHVPLGSTATPGTYQGKVEVGISTPGNLRVKVAHAGKSFEIAPQRRQR